MGTHTLLVEGAGLFSPVVGVDYAPAFAWPTGLLLAATYINRRCLSMVYGTSLLSSFPLTPARRLVSSNSNPRGLELRHRFQLFAMQGDTTQE